MVIICIVMFLSIAMNKTLKKQNPMNISMLNRICLHFLKSDFRWSSFIPSAYFENIILATDMQ